jgi:hypothetical protein
VCARSLSQAVKLNEDAKQVGAMAKWVKRGEAKLKQFDESLGHALHRSHSDSARARRKLRARQAGSRPRLATAPSCARLASPS